MIPTELLRYNQFINWTYMPDSRGEPTKVPIDQYGRKIDAHNPANWKSYQDLQQSGYNIAFVLTDHDPFFCIDLDACVFNHQIQPWANEVLQRFPNSFNEFSVSGNGVHIWGCGRPPDNHRRVFNHLGHKVEFYSGKRFIALGQHGAGNIWQDFTYHLAHFVPVGDIFDDTPITQGPDDEYTGPDDDDELIQLMLRSRGGLRAVFGDNISIPQLWFRDVTALAIRFPDSRREFDHNAADMSLLTQLAFWTGRHGERMDRLFRRSGLMRDKWDQRPDYRARSITGACRAANAVYNRPREDQSESVQPPPTVPIATSEFLTPFEQEKYFEECVFITEVGRVFTPYGMLNAEKFKGQYGGHEFALGAGSRTTRNAYEAFINGPCGFTGQYRATRQAFKPDMPTGIFDHENVRYCNTFRAPFIRRLSGDFTPFINHIAKLLPNHNDQIILLSYMAAMIQYPGVKFRWCPVLQGVQGNGKSMLLVIMREIIGRQYCHVPPANKLGKDFNAWLENKLFIGINEIYVADRREIVDRMKEFIADEFVESEGKGRDQIMIDNCVNFMACTNHKDAIMKEQGDRRYCVFYTAQQTFEDREQRDGLTTQYFVNMWDWLKNRDGFAIIADYLLRVEIPDEYNPATLCQVAPKSSMEAEVIAESKSPTQLEILEAIESEYQGFRDGWVSSVKLSEHCVENNIRVSKRAYRHIMEELGYIQHPIGRISIPLLEEHNKKPVLYVHRNSQYRHLTTMTDVINQYRLSQGYDTFPSATRLHAATA